nr:DUF2314 domain-containing protein [Variovorax boronicumulans]
MFFWRKKKSKLEEPQAEPLFMAVPSMEEELSHAYARAAASMAEFRTHIERQGDHICSAKLRFKDPNESDRMGKDVLLFLWLTAIEYNPASDSYIGTFFEVPPELGEWHCAGQKLEFDGADVFDWMVNDDGILHGGFTLRVNRKRLPEGEREAFDRYVGVRQWAQWGGH